MENENVKSDMEEFSTLLKRNTNLAKVCVMVATFCSASSLASFYGMYIVFVFRISSPEMTLIYLYAPLASCSVFQLFGGILGDAIFGHYSTIVYGFAFSMCGFTFMSLNLLELPEAWHLIYSIIGLLILSIGAGLLKFNIACFGADQIPANQDHELRAFFSYLQFAASIGMLAGFKGFSLLVDSRYFFLAGYLFSSVLMLVGVIVFVFPHKSAYHIVIPGGKLRFKCFQIIINAMRRNRLIAHEEYETFPSPKEWLDRAKIRYGGKYTDKEVDDIKRVFNTFPVWLFLIVYFTLVSQLTGTFLIQGNRLECIENSNQSFCWCLSFTMITVIVLTPIVYRFGYPMLDKLDAMFPHIWRISIGMIFATLSLLLAGIVETFQYQKNTNTSTDSGTSPWYVAPQHMFMGASIVFVIPAVFEFTYYEAPKHMRSTVMSFFDIVIPIGALLDTAFILIGKAVSWDILHDQSHDQTYSFTQVMRGGNLHYYFFFLAALNFINLIAFLIYGVRKTRRAKLDEDYVAAFIRANLYGSLTDSKNLITKDAKDDFPEFQKVNWFDEAS